MTKAVLQIRPMVSDDIAQVAELAGQLGYPGDLNEFHDRFGAMAYASSNALFVAHDDQKIAGWIHIHQEPPTLLSPTRAEIVALVVDEKEQSKGIGRELLRRAEDWARAHHFKIIRLRSSLKRERAHAFYLRQGYENTKTSHMFVKTLT